MPFEPSCSVPPDQRAASFDATSGQEKHRDEKQDEAEEREVAGCGMGRRLQESAECNSFEQCLQYALQSAGPGCRELAQYDELQQEKRAESDRQAAQKADPIRRG